MIDAKKNYVEGASIQDVWREVMWLCVNQGYDFVVKGGSYVGQIRKQLPFVTLNITQPWLRPLAPIMPPSLPLPTTDEKIEFYFVKYLMDDIVEKHEQYTYGSFIKPQLQRVIELLTNSNGNSNQACISVGDRESVHLADPPCLRLIDFKVVEGRLNMTVFFRSWDLFAGLPENLGGLQLVKEYALSQLQENMKVEDGGIIAHSSGLHIYEQYFDLVNMMNIEQIEVSSDVMADKISFGNKLDKG